MMARGETPAADSCLSSPQGETPPGGHWRYHIDHANKRNCWYLRLEDGGVSQAIPQNSQPSPSPIAKPSVADARAEFRPQAVREDTLTVSPPSNNAAGKETSSANTSIWNATAAVATRWPALPPAFAMPKVAASTAAPASDVTQSSTDPVPAAARSAPFTYLSMPIRPEMIPTLFAATIGALAFAGAAALISRRRRTRLRRRVAQSARDPVWETTDDDRIILSDYPSQDKAEYRPRFARSVKNAAPSNKRAAEFASRAPRYARR
ncbi:hypothetical protein [Bradyrhizobium sp.]|uniref:hypothetical protein n=1 Tax=Bradyrhizobium sp. TaxID=376 RepID=UPI003BE4A622